jgi:hypothetical protein
MRAFLPLLALGLTAAFATATPLDELSPVGLCRTAIRLMDEGQITEKQASDLLQNAIDRAKKDLEAHKAADAKTVERLLSAKELAVSISLSYSDSCCRVRFGPVQFVRKQDQITVAAGKTRRQTFSLVGEAEGEKALRESFENLRALVRQLAASPPECKWLAESTPAKLLEKRREMKDLIGDSTHSRIAVTLKDEQGDLVIEEYSGAHLQEAFGWDRSLTKALPDSAAKPPAAPAAR